MKKSTVGLLILDDNDMNCDPKDERSIDKMSLSDVGFSALVIKDYGLIVYQGKKGTKILKNTAFGVLGIISRQKKS